jgi:CDP-diacylglycerol--serine O-phosphatidyltransferase
MKPTRRPLRRPSMRRAVILFPSGLTLGNLFFGIFAIIAASRKDFVEAGVYVLLGGACDALDGQVARATNAGTQFGEELDSLVDAITFGLAPGLIMYFAVFNQDSWDWLSVFFFSACAVMRLARFNIEQAGTAKTYFQGLPSPAAGITLASYYWFSQSWLYNYGAIANLKWHVLLRFLMLALAFLMISNIPYPVFPRTGFRSLRAIGATLLLLGSMALLATRRLEFFFPAALCYVAWGPIRWVFSGLFERRQPTIPYDLSEGEDDEEEDEADAFGPMDSQVHANRQSERTPRVPRAERERGRRERVEKTTTTSRSERPSRTESAAPAKPERDEVRERAASAERPARSERTEAERAARREKREKRDKRREREVRSAPAGSEPQPESGVGAITLGAPAPEVTAVAPVLSVVRTDGEAAPAAETADRVGTEGTPARKRKRRRRRGQRDRLAAEGGDAADVGDAGDAGDFGEDEGGDAGSDSSSDAGGDESEPRAERAPRNEPRSPYSEPPFTSLTISEPSAPPAPAPSVTPPVSAPSNPSPSVDHNE